MSAHRTSPRVDLRSRVGGRFLRLVNPLARKMIRAGMSTGAPNVLLTMRGRRSGKLRTVPVGLVELDGQSYIQSSYGETGWVANLRADGQATITRSGGEQESVRAFELPSDEGGAVLRRALQRFPRSRALRVLLGPTFRPPVGVFWQLRKRVDDTVEEYAAEARRHPLFELRSADEARRRPATAVHN
jgi:deazaflavin-dependent oxidoreductase (nitroreductase family)